jgi:hypothetical protein
MALVVSDLLKILSGLPANMPVCLDSESWFTQNIHVETGRLRNPIRIYHDEYLCDEEKVLFLVDDPERLEGLSLIERC